MTLEREKAIKMLKAKLECMTRDVSGCDDDCNRKLCDECHLNYEQGNMGEQKEYLRMSIEALEQEPSEDCISREQAINVLSDALKGVFVEHEDVAEKILSKVPSVTSQPFINKPCVSEGVCREDKIQVLDKIRTEIKTMSDDVETLSDVLDIIDRYKAESDGN